MFFFLFFSFSLILTYFFRSNVYSDFCSVYIQPIFPLVPKRDELLYELAPSKYESESRSSNNENSTAKAVLASSHESEENNMENETKKDPDNQEYKERQNQSGTDDFLNSSDLLSETPSENNSLPILFESQFENEEASLSQDISKTPPALDENQIYDLLSTRFLDSCKFPLSKKTLSKIILNPNIV